MKMPFVKTTWEAAIRANVLLSLAALVLSIVTAIVVMNSQGKHERIVITPMVIDKPMSVAWNTADENYIKAFALSVAELVGNMTPSNVTFVLDSMSRFIHPSIYADLRKNILAITDTRQFKEVSTATRFVPTLIVYEAESSKVFVYGNVETSTSVTKDRHVMTYEMTIRIENGMPSVYSFDNYADMPHDKDWIVKDEAAKALQKSKEPAKAGEAGDAKK